jgi:hypothetical protein
MENALRPRIANIILIVILGALMVSCSKVANNIKVDDNNVEQVPETVNKIRIDKNDCVYQEISPIIKSEKLIEMQGSSSEKQEATIKSDSSIRFYWNQLSTENFILSITNLDPKMENDTGRTIIIESMLGPSSGCNDISVLEGNYEIEVESSDGEWIVLSEIVTYKNEQ